MAHAIVYRQGSLSTVISALGIVPDENGIVTIREDQLIAIANRTIAVVTVDDPSDSQAVLREFVKWGERNGEDLSELTLDASAGSGPENG